MVISAQSGVPFVVISAHLRISCSLNVQIARGVAEIIALR